MTGAEVWDLSANARQLRMATLVMIVGPIASGKSTVSAELGRIFRVAGRPVAVLDLDDHIMTIGGFVGLEPENFGRSLAVFGDLVGAWLREGFDVIGHGPFFKRDEDAAVVGAAPTGTQIVRAELQCTYEVARTRVTADAARRHLATNSEFLRPTYDRVGALRPLMRPADYVFDSTVIDWHDVAGALAQALLSDSG